MHALPILHRALSSCDCHIHARRLDCLCAAAQAATQGKPVTLSALGQGLPGPASIKHNIKRIDRLLGNRSLHAEIPMLYQAMVQHYLASATRPIIIIDWSDLTPDRHWQLLRASLALSGRSITVYEQVHPLTQSNTPAVHAAFLQQLSAMLPHGCVPILLTDAGFRSPWFKLVNQLGWHWIGRIRNRDMVRTAGTETWLGCKTLYAKASCTARSLGAHDYVRSNPVRCHLVLVKRQARGRHKHGVQGQSVRSKHSLKNAQCQREPWLLAICPALAHMSAEAAVGLYAKRMQIEEAFRDLKSERFGLGLSASRSKDQHRLSVLLLIACLAWFVLRLIGQAATHRNLARHCQSNTRCSRPVLSTITLAHLIISRKIVSFTATEIKIALCYLRKSCSNPII